MSFFTHSSGVVINGGSFMSINLPTQGAAAASTPITWKGKECDNSELDPERLWNGHRRISRNSDGLMIVKAHEVDLHRELISGNRYRIHAASHEGRFVAVKTFEGPCAKQDWTADVAFSKEVLHPNMLKIVGVSDESAKSHFVLFHGITSEQKMQSLIAKALGTDLNTSILLSMKAVRGIAAGLSYIMSQNIPMPAGTTKDNQKWENFDIFTGYDNEPIISFHPPSTINEDGSVSQTYDFETDYRGVEVLNGICQQLFSAANSILYDDSPERKFDTHDTREGLPTATVEDAEGTSNISKGEVKSDPSNSTEKPKANRPPRREVWWLDVGATSQSLESIKRCFGDRLDHCRLSSSKSLLRRIRSSRDNLRRNLHQCPGYLREEITLTSDLSRSAIISHAFPTQRELCSICGQLVQYAYSEPSVIDEDVELIMNRMLMPSPLVPAKHRRRVPPPPSAEYLSTLLSDNPLGLANMIPAEELYEQSEPSEPSTPWIWNPAELAYDEDESSASSQPYQYNPYNFVPPPSTIALRTPTTPYIPPLPASPLPESPTSSQSHQYYSYNRPWGSYTPWASTAKLPHDESSTSSQSHRYFYTPWASSAQLPHDESSTSSQHSYNIPWGFYTPWAPSAQLPHDESSTSSQSHQYYSDNRPWGSYTPWASSAKLPHDEVSTSSQPYQYYPHQFVPPPSTNAPSGYPPGPYSSHDPSIPSEYPSPSASTGPFLSPNDVPRPSPFIFPSEEFKSQSQSPPEDIQTPPWTPNPSPPQSPQTPPWTPNFSLPHTTPPAPAEPEAFTSKQDLRPTFGPNIIRTPRHYLRRPPLSQ